MISLKNIFIRIENVLDSLNERKFVLYIVASYFLLVLVNTLNHEMWFDEIQAWLIARDSTSLSNLFYNLRYDGHPPLWYISIFLITRVTHKLIAMQILHLVIAAFSVYVLLKYALFTRIQKILIVFGYFFLYEYSAISRNYAYGILFIFLFCAFYRPGIGKNYILLAVILFFLSMANVYSFLITFALACMMLLEILLDADIKRNISKMKVKLCFAFIIIFLGLFLSAVVMKPDDDFGTTHGFIHTFNLRHFQRTVRCLYHAYVPIPRFGIYSYWNTNFISGRSLPTNISILLFSFFLFAFSRKIYIEFLFAFTTLIFMVFQYFVYIGYLRHSGHYFVMLIVCMWLSNYYQNDDRLKSIFNSKIVEFCDKRKIFVLNIILCIHFCSGFFVSGMEIQRDFSIAPKVAEYIIKNDMASLPILGYENGRICMGGSVLSAYVKTPIYYPQGDRYGTFIVLDKKCNVAIDEQSIIQKAKDISKEKRSDILLLLREQLQESYGFISEIKEFDYESILGQEKFYLYLMKKNNID